MKKQIQNKKRSVDNAFENKVNELFKNDKQNFAVIDEHEVECKNKCKKLSYDQKRKMVGFGFKYIYHRCDELNKYIENNNGSCSIGNYKVVVGGFDEDEIKYKELYVQDKIRLILEEVKSNPIEYFESYVKSVKHLKHEFKIHENSQILMHDDNDEISIQAHCNL